MNIIEVDMDRKCLSCGKGGATGVDGKDGDLCMECIAKRLTGGGILAGINTEVLQLIATKVEDLLLENEEKIADSYKKIPDGMKISIGIDLDPTTTGISVNYTVSFPLEPKPEAQLKETVKLKQVINIDQGNLFDEARG